MLHYDLWLFVSLVPVIVVCRTVKCHMSRLVDEVPARLRPYVQNVSSVCYKWSQMVE